MQYPCEYYPLCRCAAQGAVGKVYLSACGGEYTFSGEFKNAIPLRGIVEEAVLCQLHCFDIEGVELLGDTLDYGALKLLDGHSQSAGFGGGCQQSDIEYL